MKTIQNKVNTSVHITKYPHITKPTYTHPHITKQVKTPTVKVKTKTVQVKTNTEQDIPK